MTYRRTFLIAGFLSLAAGAFATTLPLTHAGSSGAGPAWQYNFAATNALPGDGSVSVSTPSLGGLVADSTGALTYAPNNLIRSGASMSTQTTDVNLQTQTNYLLCFSGTGTVTVSGAYSSGALSAGANKFTPTSPVSATLSVIGTVTNASLSAVTYETQCRATDAVYNATDYYGPKFDYGKGLRIWGQSINSVPNSNTPTSWGSLPNITLTPNATASPDGGNNGWKWASTGSGPVSAGTTYVAWTIAAGAGSASVYMKKAEYQYGYFGVSSGGDYVIVDLIAGTVALAPTYAGSTATVSNAGNGWWRVQLYSANAAGTAKAVLFCPNANITTGNFTAGSGGYLFGGQMEIGAASASPYIPTGSAAVVSSPDAVTLAGTPLTTLGGASASLVVEADASATATQNTLLALHSSAYYLAALASENGETNPTASLSATTANAVTISGATSFREAVALAASSAKIALNGGAVAAGAGTSATVTALDLGSANSANYLNGHLHGLSVYNSALSSATLTSKSTCCGGSY